MRTDLRLYHLFSPTLPVGGFTYSQGMEWAVEAGWIADRDSLERWLLGALVHSVSCLDLPILLRLLDAVHSGDSTTVDRWCRLLLASRETAELRAEERQRGAALARLLPALGIDIPDAMRATTRASQLAGIALAARHWDIDPARACAGFCWNWLDNMVTAGVKLVPLGQTQGQQALLGLSEHIPAAVDRAQALQDDDIGSCTPALAIASSRHESQYTRLFRS